MLLDYGFVNMRGQLTLYQKLAANHMKHDKLGMAEDQDGISGLTALIL